MADDNQAENALARDVLRSMKAVELATQDRNARVGRLSEVQPLSAKKQRHVRAALLSSGVLNLSDLLSMAGLDAPILVTRHGTWLEIDGVWLRCDRDAYYLRSDNNTRSLGRKIDALARTAGIVPSTILDIGANQGEVAIWLARQYPHARVIAIEGSSATYDILRSNITLPIQNCTNVEALWCAITDYDGEITFSIGKGTENGIVGPDAALAAGDRATRETVPCMTLSTLWQSKALDVVDIVKIDVEGAEPTLTEDIGELSDRIRSFYIEYSYKASAEDYARLTRMLYAKGFVAQWRAVKIANETALGALLDENVFRPRSAADVFFARNEA